MTDPKHAVLGTRRARAIDPKNPSVVVACVELHPKTTYCECAPGLTMRMPLTCPCDLAGQCERVMAEREMALADSKPRRNLRDGQVWRMADGHEGVLSFPLADEPLVGGRAYKRADFGLAALVDDIAKGAPCPKRARFRLDHSGVFTSYVLCRPVAELEALVDSGWRFQLMAERGGEMLSVKLDCSTACPCELEVVCHESNRATMPAGGEGEVPRG